MMIFGQTGRNEMIGVCQHQRWTRRGGQGEGLPYYDDDGDDDGDDAAVADDDDEPCHAQMLMMMMLILAIS